MNSNDNRYVEIYRLRENLIKDIQTSIEKPNPEYRDLLMKIVNDLYQLMTFY